MKGLKSLNLSLAFALELAMLAALVYWGFHLDTHIFFQILAGVGLPVLVTLIWGVWLAPTADMRPRLPWLIAIKAVLFGLSSLALISVGQSALGVALLTAFAAHEILSIIWGQEQKNPEKKR